MSDPTGVHDSLQAALIQLAWRQWTALGASGRIEPDRRPVDPEALIVMTARLGTVDARLRGVAVDWCLAAGHLVNEARLVALVAEMGGLGPDVANFLAIVRAAGGPSWLNVPADGRHYASRRKAHLTNYLAEGQLLLRLRAMLGVNARAEIVAILLGRSSPMPLAELARRSRFSRANIDRIAGDLAMAGLLEVSRPSPRKTLVRLAPRGPLARVAGRTGPLPDWPARYIVALRILAALDRWEAAPAVVVGIEARELLSELDPCLEAAGFRPPDSRPTGDDYLHGFYDWTTGFVADIAGGKRF